MTDFESTIILLLILISLLLFIIVLSMPPKTDKDIKKLLKQICENTRDKTIPVKPVNVTVTEQKISKWASCPICGKLIHDSEKHCEKCGAKIDWSDTE